MFMFRSTERLKLTQARNQEFFWPDSPVTHCCR